MNIEIAMKRWYIRLAIDDVRRRIHDSEERMDCRSSIGFVNDVVKVKNVITLKHTWAFFQWAETELGQRSIPGGKRKL